jgi:NTE family protein
MGLPAPFTATELRNGAIRTLLREIDIKILPDVLEERLDDAIVEALAQDERLRHPFALIERGGWYGAEHFLSWLRTRLDSGPWKGGQRHFSAMTLAQFYAETQVDLSLVAADTSGGRLLVLNHHTAPDCPVVWAVRMSMSIPLVWEEVIWESEWGLYLADTAAGHSVVDGGLLSNFPIELFISGEPQVTRLMGPKVDDPVMGLLIDESLPVPPQLTAVGGALVDINVRPQDLRTVQRVLRLANTVTGAHDKMVIDAFSDLVVRLPAGGYGTTEFDMTDQRRAALVEAGRQAMRTYLDRPFAAGAPPAELGTAEMESGKRTADRIAKHLLGQ